MKRISLTIFCILVIFSLGYTAYANTVKKDYKKTTIKDIKDIRERLFQSHIISFQNFSSTTMKLLPPNDIVLLSTEIANLKSSKLKIENKIASSTLLISKVSFLNMYINDLKKNSQNQVSKTKKTSKNNIPNVLISKPLKISKELIHSVVMATSTQAVQKIRSDFYISSMPESSKIKKMKDKIKTANSKPVSKIPKPKVLKVIATTTPIVSPEIVTSTTSAEIFDLEINTSTTTATSSLINEDALKVIATTTPIVSPEIVTSTTSAEIFDLEINTSTTTATSISSSTDTQ